jgi:cyanophycin synthetase
VLNADDPLVMKMAGYTEAKHICYVTINPQHALVREHVRAGARACALEGGVNGHMITLYDKGGHIPLLWTHLIPATLEGRATHNVQNAMFAAAMAFSLGIKLDAIRQGLRTFDTTFFQAPGRMNVFNEHPFKVLFDYGHNGRGPEEVPRIQAAALQAAGVPADAISVIPDEQAAIDAALRMGAPGDLVLIFADVLVRSWKQIIKFKPASAGETHAAMRAPAVSGASRDGAHNGADGAAAAAQAQKAAEAAPPAYSLEGLIRDERGVRYAPEAED